MKQTKVCRQPLKLSVEYKVPNSLVANLEFRGLG